MRRGLVAVTALAAVSAVACGGSGPDVVVEGTPPATPYTGPLDVPTRSVNPGAPTLET